MKCIKCNSLFDYLKSINMKCIECKAETKRLAEERRNTPENKAKRIKLSLEKRIIESHKKYPDGSDLDTFVECKLCNFRSADIGTHVLVSHNISAGEYKETYGNFRSKSNLELILGDKNPAYNHGGRLSPFSKNFLHYTSDEAIADLGRKSVKTRTKNNNNNSTIEFYTSRGHSIEEAEKLLSKRQTTFSLEKCIKKYGEQEGYIIWQERQDKWQNTLNSKTDEEKSELNSKRSVLGFHSLWCDEIDIPGYFYVIQVEDKVKIGITTKDNINKRYKGLKKLDDVFIKLFAKTETIKHAFAIEQLLCKKYRSNIKTNLDQKYKMFGSQEIISDIDVNIILKEAQEYINNQNFTYSEFDLLRNFV